MTKDKASNHSFHGFYMPQIGASITGASRAKEEGDNEFANTCLDAAEDFLAKAKDQTERQIAARDSGTYDPNEYLEDTSILEETPEEQVTFAKHEPWQNVWGKGS